jgi:hypothetical protein
MDGGQCMCISSDTHTLTTNHCVKGLNVRELIKN